jgi:hypothetical protein
MHVSESFKVSYNSLNNRINPNTKDASNNGNSETAKFSFSSDTITSHTALSALSFWKVSNTMALTDMLIVIYYPKIRLHKINLTVAKIRNMIYGLSVKNMLFGRR